MKPTSGNYTVEFSEMGGYDCMTDAFYIKSDKGQYLATLDLGSYGQSWRRKVDNLGPTPAIVKEQAEANARLFAAAPELLSFVAHIFPCDKNETMNHQGADRSCTCGLDDLIARILGKDVDTKT